MSWKKYKGKIKENTVMIQQEEELLAKNRSWVRLDTSVFIHSVYVFNHSYYPGPGEDAGKEAHLLRGYKGDDKRFIVNIQQKLRIYLASVNPFPDGAEFEYTIGEKFKEAMADAKASMSKAFYNLSCILTI